MAFGAANTFWMNILLTAIFLFFVALIGIIPFWFLYRFSDFMYFLMRALGYRKSVIESNLKRCFPDKDDAFYKNLRAKIYHNLTDILIEGIKALSMSRRQINRRHKILNPELLEDAELKNKSIIAVTGHYGNWEWGSMSASLQSGRKIVALYKPLSNKYIDKILMNKARKRSGTHMLSIYETSQGFEKYAPQNAVFLMAADQSPARGQKDRAYWVDFMGIKTAFLHGLEKYARKYDLPIVYIDIERIKRGYYEINLETLVASPKEMPEGEITALFAQRLEKQIRNKPENWLWSHRRWKLND